MENGGWSDIVSDPLGTPKDPVVMGPGFSNFSVPWPLLSFQIFKFFFFFFGLWSIQSPQTLSETRPTPLRDSISRSWGLPDVSPCT